MSVAEPLFPMMHPLAQSAAEYWIDAWQRTVLTWDVLRARGNQYLEHEKSGKPPVLVFDYEIVADGRELAQPANYALTRIKPPEGYPASDPTKRPFVVIDPRAGHGPGIGGFKMDSEIGVARHAVNAARLVLRARGELSPQDERRMRRVEQILGVDAPLQAVRSA